MTPDAVAMRAKEVVFPLIRCNFGPAVREGAVREIARPTYGNARLAVAFLHDKIGPGDAGEQPGEGLGGGFGAFGGVAGPTTTGQRALPSRARVSRGAAWAAVEI